jgi:hypothetical protein
MLSQPFENETTASAFVNVVCGAVQSVLGHPTDSNICFAGTTNGGIWRTTSCRDIVPDWYPLTDDQPNLSIGDMVFDAADRSGNTILAGVGRFSAMGALGGVSMGLLYTQNALDDVPTWTVLDNAEGDVNFLENEVQFRDVFVHDTLMLAAAIMAAKPDECCNRGIFRSTNRGRTWTNVLMGTGRALASDPSDPNRFYATLDNVGHCTGRKHRTHGVYTSADLATHGHDASQKVQYYSRRVIECEAQCRLHVSFWQSKWYAIACLEWFGEGRPRNEFVIFGFHFLFRRLWKNLCHDG